MYLGERNMYTIDKEYSKEYMINKSRFICYLAPCKTVEEANDYLNAIRKKHYDATHNCYSYIIGEEGDITKNSDDGEPSQTAGIVIYNVLNKNNITNCICIVTRYFGGIKLGAGGLIRAYGSSVSETLKDVKLKKLFRAKVIKIIFDYPFHNEILKLLDKYNILEQFFTEVITIKVEVPSDKIDQLKTNLIDITKGNIDFEIHTEEYLTY